NVEENELETNAILEYNGSVILFRSMITDITCNLNLRDFPFDQRYDCCPQPFYDITYFLVLKRSPSYYIFSLVIPSAFITVVTIVGFFTPHSTTGENTEKVSLGVTALLSMAIIS
uniref:Neurotransmitter-gated ion-channel ligand-binding domain-containing protein n=1 Tax=Parascaris univalens TaxID=6257 RepID=A0A915CGP1_PARUN